MNNGEKNIIVLMSTFNGEKYLRDQLDSLIKQEEVDVYILIRDDGSTDSTISILQDYSKEYKNIEYYCGKNIGVVSSFNDLIMNPRVDEYDFVAFCDQDDIWMPMKIRKALELMKLEKQDIPSLYCSNLTVVNEKLEELCLMRERPNYTKKNGTHSEYSNRLHRNI